MRTRLRPRLVPLFGAFLALLLGAHGATAQDNEPNNTSGTASAVGLALGGSRSIFGSLAPGGTDFDYYAIALTERQILVVTTAPSGGDFDVPDTQIRVFDTDGSTELVEDDDSGSDFPEGEEYGSTVRFRAPATGTYYLVVTGCCDAATHNEVGQYELLLGLTIQTAAETVDSDPANDTTGGADDLGITASGGTVLHVATLEEGSAGDVDMYEVALGAGDTLVATTVPFGGTLDDPDTEMGIFDGSTWYVIDDDAGNDFPDGNEYGSTVRFRAPSGGVYYLVTSGDDDQGDGALDGDHSQVGDYAFVASVTSSLEVPEIPTLSRTGILLLGLLLAGAGWMLAQRRL